MAAESGQSGALAGLRVLDISTFLAAPQVSAMLADFGADVIKVEPPEGEALRKIGAQRRGGSLMWALTSRNKRTITCDLNRPEGRELFLELVAVSDVVVENYPPEMLAAWGLSYADLSAVNPSIVLVSVSCYGQDGPLADRPGAGTLAEAYAGLTHMTGEPDGPPMLPSLPLGDTLVAFSGVIGALVAAYHVKVHGGPGQHVDVTMYEPVLTILQSTLIAWDQQAGEEPPVRTGSRISTGVPRNVYRTSDDRWVVVSGTTDRQVARMLSIIGQDHDEGRARFAKSRDRLANGDALDALVAEWIAEHPLDEVVATMVDNRIPVAPVNDVAQIVADPHVQARQSVVQVHDDTMGVLNMVGPVPKLSATPGAIRFSGPAIGSSNDAVYRDLLGCSDERLAALRDAGAI